MVTQPQVDTPISIAPIRICLRRQVIPERVGSCQPLADLPFCSFSASERAALGEGPFGQDGAPAAQ